MQLSMYVCRICVFANIFAFLSTYTAASEPCICVTWSWYLLRGVLLFFANPALSCLCPFDLQKLGPSIVMCEYELVSYFYIFLSCDNLYFPVA